MEFPGPSCVDYIRLRPSFPRVAQRKSQAMILTPETATPRCTAIVDLISRVQRPYLFRVTVSGQFPHNWRQVYTIAAESDDSAAMKGLELFVKSCMNPIIRAEMATLAPKAKLQ